MAVTTLVATVMAGAVGAQAQSRDGPQILSPAAGGRIGDYELKHGGVDIHAVPGEIIRTDLAGIIVRLEGKSDWAWRGVTLRAMIDGTSVMFRLLGVASDVPIGVWIPVGVALGRAIDPETLWPGVKPHLHVEAYVDGKRVDPTALVPRLLSGRPVVDPGNSIGDRRKEWPATRRTLVALKAANAAQFDEALRHLSERVKRPDWETSGTLVYRSVAELAAKKRNFARAVAIQQIYLDLLQLEFHYADGKLPDLRLGPIAAAYTADDVFLLFINAAVDLDVYARLGQWGSRNQN